MNEEQNKINLTTTPDEWMTIDRKSEKSDTSSKPQEVVKKVWEKFDYNSPVILTFAVMSFVVLLLGMLTQMASTRLLFAVYRTSFIDPLFYIRLFGHTLGHANLTHYFNNFLIILLVGPVLEEKYGWKKMLIMIVSTSLIIGILHAAVSNETMLLGASGVAFMFIILNSYVNLKEGRIPITLILCVALFMGREIANQIRADDYDNISHFSHIIGGLCGAGFGYWINRDKIKGAAQN